MGISGSLKSGDINHGVTEKKITLVLQFDCFLII